MKNATEAACHGSEAMYASAGVDTRKAESALAQVKEVVRRTFSLSGPGGRPVLDVGYFANVLDLDGSTGLAICTDGVGTKILVAERMRKYDTIGIDCLGMNVNDLLCVGARPTALVDYVAVERLDEAVMLEIIHGLADAARQARVSIPGGEIAQMKDCIRGERPGSGLDLVGTAVGLVELEKIIVGKDLAEGDVVVGLASNGLHSNGYTLARKVFFEQQGWDVGRHIAELGETLGEALLRPTRIYVAEVMAMFEAGLRIKALAHITGDGLLNVLRTEKAAGYVIDTLPEAPAIFRVLQAAGGVSTAEMFRVFNMGVGLCITVDPGDAEAVCAIAAEHGVGAAPLGRVSLADADLGKVRMIPAGLVGDGATGRFQAA